MIQIIQILIYVLSAVLLTYLLLSAFYFFFFAVFSKFKYTSPNMAIPAKKVNVDVLIPSYKEDSVIVETALSASMHQSIHANVRVTVIADSLQIETLNELSANHIKYIAVSFVKSTKALALNEALMQLDRDSDYVLVLDADNLMADNALDEIVKCINTGYSIVQGHRTAKNANTDFALLDGLSEEINNSIFRLGHRNVGLSAALIGSGFICETALFKNVMEDVKAVGGFDKELELYLLERKIKIGYAEKAHFLDEKIQKADAFVNQRRRWLSAQLVYLGKNSTKAIKLLFFKGNLDYFDKTLQYALPPRILALFFPVLMLVFLLSLVMWLQYSYLFVYLWGMVLILNVFSIIIAIPKTMWTITYIKAMMHAPKGFFFMMLALFKIKDANKSFIHTKHGSI